MSHPISVPSSTPTVHDQLDSKVVKHGYKVFTSTARKEQSRQAHQGSPISQSSMSRPNTPSPGPIMSPITKEPKDSNGVTENSTTPSHTENQATKSKPNSVSNNGQNRSQSFSHPPSYSNYHKGQRGYLRNVTGVNHVNHNPFYESNCSRAEPDSTNRPGSSNSGRVAALTGNNLRSGSFTRGGRRGGFNNRYTGPVRPPFPPNGGVMYPRFPGPQIMVPMSYPYYSGGFPMTLPPQPGTPLLVPDPTCRCNECVNYFASLGNGVNAGCYPYPFPYGPTIMQPQQVGGQVPSDTAPRTYLPVGQYMPAPIPASPFIQDYAAYVSQQQSLVYHQPQVNMAPMASTSNPPTRNGQGGQGQATESKNELTPIEAPNPVMPTNYGDGFYASTQQPYYILPAMNHPPGNFAGDSGHNGQPHYNGPANAQAGGQGNTLPYTFIPDRVIQNTPQQPPQHKR